MVLTDTGLAKVFQRIKSFVLAQLNSKASAVHTHTSSDITDLPSGLTVDSTLDATSSNAIANSAVKNALDGKSDTGHTHTKSEITDFPSYGTTANTICEGNDSRLSDARTPIAHTHTASDISSGLASVATSGSYNDLSNKPTIPTYSAGSNLSLNDTTFNVSSTPSFTSITVSGYTITID